MAEPYLHPIWVSTARASLSGLIFQFMARALQSTTRLGLRPSMSYGVLGWLPVSLGALRAPGTAMRANG